MTRAPADDDGDQPARLGELLAPGSPWHDRPTPEPPSPVDAAWRPVPLGSAVAWLARQHGEDAEQVLKDLRGPSALARMLRKLLGHQDMSRNLRAYLMSTGLDMSSDDKNALISEFLTIERDPLGNRIGGTTPKSVDRYIRRGRVEFETEERMRQLAAIADLFGRTDSQD